MKANKYSAKKRMMFIQKEDYNFLAYNLLVLLDTLGCTEESKKFRDFRKIAYLVDFINSDRQLNDYSQNELASIYSKAHLKKQLMSHLLVVLKNKNYIDVSINSTYNSFDIWLQKENIPSDFFNKEVFKNEISNIIELKKLAHSLKTVPIIKLVDSLFTSKNVLTWEV